MARVIFLRLRLRCSFFYKISSLFFLWIFICRPFNTQSSADVRINKKVKRTKKNRKLRKKKPKTKRAGERGVKIREIKKECWGKTVDRNILRDRNSVTLIAAATRNRELRCNVYYNDRVKSVSLTWHVMGVLLDISYCICVMSNRNRIY